MKLTVIILAKNEECHVERALASVASIADQCIVVDSGSSDRTMSLARSAGAVVIENPWVNHAVQFNWALSQLPEETEWVLRLDADEIVTEQLANEIRSKLALLPDEAKGVFVSRRMHFLRRRINWGGVFPIRVLRLFRHGHGRCESRWMDEHIIVDGNTTEFSGEIVDDNLRSLTWWTEKHNSYASREVVDILNQQYKFMPQDSVARLRGGKQVGNKRWIKENVYARLPSGLRAFGYFFYRYILRLGFLDGIEGTAFHVLQGFWYRYLVDMKLYEVESYMKNGNVDVVVAINDVLRVNVRSQAKIG